MLNLYIAELTINIDSIVVIIVVIVLRLFKK